MGEREEGTYSEGNLGVELVVAVDPDGSGLEEVSGPECAGDVSGEDWRGRQRQ
jgi:hypothetical protein